MFSAVLFLTLGAGSVVEYDHGYHTGAYTNQDGTRNEGRYVPLVDKFVVIGTYAGNYFNGEHKGALILDRLGKDGKPQGRGSYEIVTPTSMRKLKVLKHKPRTEPLVVFDDSDLSITITEGPQ